MKGIYEIDTVLAETPRLSNPTPITSRRPTDDLTLDAQGAPRCHRTCYRERIVNYVKEAVGWRRS